MNILHNISLKPYNTFKIDVKAEYFFDITDAKQLKPLFEDKEVKSLKFMVIGEGSNLLFKEDYKGLILRMGIKGISVYEAEDSVFIRSGGGEKWNDLVEYCIDKGYPGIENLSAIPGTVGAAPVQNIGAYGIELKDVCHQVEVFDTQTLVFKSLQANECNFGYRDSMFKNEAKGRYIVTAIILKLSKNAKLNTSYGAIQSELTKRHITQPTSKDISEVVAYIRYEKLPNPVIVGNAGSFFKNPVVTKDELEKIKLSYPNVVSFPNGDMVKLAAGWLIEQCGWKGKIVGNTGTWEHQALVIVNYGGATGQEIYNLSEDIIKSVKDKFNVTLEREVNII
jgi:UDP-N-acetylmuramate dehydrogenase